MEILDMIQKLAENLKAHVDNYGCVVMHPSTAEELLEHYIGVKCVIEYVCPTDRIYLMQDANLARKVLNPEESE